MTTFFTSDTHFGHGGALGLYRRPFSSVAAMNEGMVERWNETIGPDDVVWHLGDFAIRQKPEMVAEILARLRGRKHLVTGNNDPPGTTAVTWRLRPASELPASATTSDRSNRSPEERASRVPVQTRSRQTDRPTRANPGCRTSGGPR